MVEYRLDLTGMDRDRFVWNAGTNTLAVTGNGLAAADAVNVPVNATIAANSLNVSAGNYTEVVTATLTY